MGYFSEASQKDSEKGGMIILYVRVSRPFNSLPRKVGIGPPEGNGKIHRHYFPSPKKRNGIGATSFPERGGQVGKVPYRKGWILGGIARTKKGP